MNKNKTLAQRVKEKTLTPYQMIARAYQTSDIYVGQIARGERFPVRGKGLEIKKELERLAGKIEVGNLVKISTYTKDPLLRQGQIGEVIQIHPVDDEESEVSVRFFDEMVGVYFDNCLTIVNM